MRGGSIAYVLKTQSNGWESLKVAFSEFLFYYRQKIETEKATFKIHQVHPNQKFAKFAHFENKEVDFESE